MVGPLLIESLYQVRPPPVRGVRQVLVLQVILHLHHQSPQVSAILPPIISAVIMPPAVGALALRVERAVPVEQNMHGKTALPLFSLADGLAHHVAPTLHIPAVDFLQRYLVLPAEGFRLLIDCIGQPHFLPYGFTVEILVSGVPGILRQAVLPRLRIPLLCLPVQNHVLLLRRLLYCRLLPLCHKLLILSTAFPWPGRPVPRPPSCFIRSPKHGTCLLYSFSPCRATQKCGAGNEAKSEIEQAQLVGLRQVPQ